MNPLVVSIVRMILLGAGTVLLSADKLLAAGPTTTTAPADANKPAGPKVVLDAGTQENADAAIEVVKKFLGFWEERKYDEAALLVAKPVRDAMLKQMKQRAMELKSLDDMRLFEHRDRLLARVHASVAPSKSRPDLKTQGIGIDMIFQDDKWWIGAVTLEQLHREVIACDRCGAVAGILL